MILSPVAALRDIAFCVGFFSRLPVPAAVHDKRTLAQAIWAAPLAGLVVGLAGAAVFFFADLGDLSSGSCAALALAGTIAITGCLHEDGLSDTADGFGGGRDRERKLEIMRDSRIGAFGAASLAMSILIRWSAIQDIAMPGPVLAALIAAHGASRGVLPAFMRFLPSARAQGLSASAGAIGVPVAGAAIVIGVAMLMPLGPAAALSSATLVAVAFLLFRSLCLRQIGGQTGDTLGAMQQVAEAIVLLTASAFL